MISYHVIDSDGYVILKGACQSEEQLPVVESGTVVVVEPDAPVNLRPAPAPSAQDFRKMAYPSIGEQLDMLWHAMNTGQIPKAQQFYNTIKAVKDKYPKPNGPN